MKVIEIISGLYGYHPAGAKGVDVLKAGERAIVSDEEAERLVGMKVARCIGDTPVNDPAKPVATPPEGGDDHTGGVDPSEDETGAEGTETPDDSAPTQEDEDDEAVLDIVDSHFTTQSLMKLTRAGMEALAAELDVDVSKCKNKAEIAALIAQVEVAAPEGGDDDDELPPDPDAAAPVV